MSAQLLTDLPARVDVSDIIDELCELGFFPADDPDPDEVAPRWATRPGRYYAVAISTSGNVVCLDWEPRDERFVGYVFTASQVLVTRPLHCDATPLGVSMLLAGLAVAVQS